MCLILACSVYLGMSLVGLNQKIKTGPYRTKAPIVVSGYHNQNLGNLWPEAGIWYICDPPSMLGSYSEQRGKNRTPLIQINN